MIGDVSELDLFVPEAMGMATALKKTTTMPHWELQYYGQRNEGKRFLIENYASAMEVLGGIIK